MGDRQYHMKLSGSAGADIDAYWEYKRIVGDDDGGEMFTPEQYEEYKKKVLPMRMKNRLFTAWTNPAGMDCKMIGPETMCFCQHRYHQHKTDFEEIPTERPIKLPCKQAGCKCVAYHYVPTAGSRPIRCRCKHMSTEHVEKRPYKCTNGRCTCDGFHSSYTCSCAEPTYKHKTVVETTDEREARGHPVGHAVPYQAMGGITGFSSLAEGYLRLDPSGQGAPDKEFLEQPITAMDHPFLRSQVHNIEGHRKAVQGRGRGRALPSSGGQPDPTDPDLQERMDQMRLNLRETDMEYMERRHQQRKAMEEQHGPGGGYKQPKTFTTGVRKEPKAGRR